MNWRWALLWLLLLAAPSLAHKASDSFIYLSPGHLRLDVALQDMLRLQSMDGNGDGQLSWGELRAAEAGFSARLQRDIALVRGEDRCEMLATLQGISQHSDGPYAVWQLRSPCLNQLQGLYLDYQLLFERDPLHRALYLIEGPSASVPGVLSPRENRLQLGGGQGYSDTVRTFFWQGVMHLVTGYDHLLFLLALLLPVLRRSEGERGPRAALRDTFWIVTMFTLAHSVTLAVATLGWLQLPSQPVEVVIALSVTVAALLALTPLGQHYQMALALGFGLVHGFGFAGMLADLLAVSQARLLALASFNIGIELAQLAVVAVLLPLLYPLRQRPLFRRVVAPATALAIALVGLFWAWSRL